MNDFDKEFGAMVLDVRRRKGLPRRDIAQELEMHETTLRRIELGDQEVKLYQAIALDELLGFGLDEFVATWRALLSKPPEEIVVRGRVYRLDA